MGAVQSAQGRGVVAELSKRCPDGVGYRRSLRGIFHQPCPANPKLRKWDLRSGGSPTRRCPPPRQLQRLRTTPAWHCSACSSRGHAPSRDQPPQHPLHHLGAGAQTSGQGRACGQLPPRRQTPRWMLQRRGCAAWSGAGRCGRDYAPSCRAPPPGPAWHCSAARSGGKPPTTRSRATGQQQVSSIVWVALLEQRVLNCGGDPQPANKRRASTQHMYHAHTTSCSAHLGADISPAVRLYQAFICSMSASEEPLWRA